jgi:hypothetical protein
MSLLAKVNNSVYDKIRENREVQGLSILGKDSKAKEKIIKQFVPSIDTKTISTNGLAQNNMALGK